ncbi:ABC transporter permease [Ruminiclostridium cellobioparum]|uniref:Transport permease protein n=1 Tax=Ruminiclostridium cellobioparum subsp. termitidis CT1112 TaxID=1195236 RepID=S0FFA1_RUMCE|nr:ABC transporter permease [Ruminiclostridium cellobioparum]EMS69127.1 ABC-type multidrug transport system, permease component [Ruminiclostridium cellobioparum subsp. termitidis CT1112]
MSSADNRFSFQRFISIIKKEFIQVKRDPISLRLPFIMPVVMMLLFGYAVNTEVDKIPTAVYDQSNTEESRAFLDKFTESDYFMVYETVQSEDRIAQLVKSGDAKAGLIIPEDYSDKVKSGSNTEIQLIIDGTEPTTARTAMSSGQLIARGFSQKYTAERLMKYGITPDKLTGISLKTDVWFNPDMESTKFTIPGLVGLILQNVTIMLTAFALVREKERSTIEQLIVTPIKSSELILGKLIPYIVIGYSGFLFSLAMCIWVFKVGIAGSVGLLLLLGFLFVYCSLSIGMLISTFAKNQMQAMIVMVFFLLPSILLSGFIFPREAMPEAISYLGYIIPLTYFLDIIRGIALKGIGLDYLWKDTAALLGFTAVILFIATKRFRKSLD